MNRLKGTITAVHTCNELSLVDILCSGTPLCAFVLDAADQAPFIRPDREVWVLFKETEVSIAKDFGGELSLQNRFESTLEAIRPGDLLAELKLDFKGVPITSIISRRSLDRMRLTRGDRITALVKTNEITLMEAE